MVAYQTHCAATFLSPSGANRIMSVSMRVMLNITLARNLEHYIGSKIANAASPEVEEAFLNQDTHNPSG